VPEPGRPHRPRALRPAPAQGGRLDRPAEGRGVGDRPVAQAEGADRVRGREVRLRGQEEPGEEVQGLTVRTTLPKRTEALQRT